MKSKILSLFAVCIRLSWPLMASEETKAEEIEALRQEIQAQETVLKELKATLQVLENPQAGAFRISLTTDGIQLEEAVVSNAELQKALEVYPPEKAILINSAPTVTHQQLVSLLDLLTQNGYGNISFVAQKTEAQP